MVDVIEKPIDDLQPHPENPREHPPEALRKLVDSIEEYGFTNPILVDGQDRILAGHLRVKAAREQDMETVPVIPLDLSDPKATAYMIADNKIQEFSEWDEQTLKPVMAELEEELDSMTATGFDEEEIESVLTMDHEEGVEPDIDPIPHPEDQPGRVEEGDLWELGGHRLICGEAADPQVHEQLIGDRDPVLCVTDPPYGVEVDHGWRDDVKNRTPSPRSGGIENDDTADWSEVYEHIRTPVIYLWHGALYAGVAKEGLESAGYTVRQQIIWAKEVHSLSRSHYHWKHEPCWYAVNEEQEVPWRGGRAQTTVWEYPSPIMATTGGGEEATDHPTQKPLSVYLVPLRNHTTRKQWILDPFAGSGPALMAAERTGRRALLIELDPDWCDVILDRWERETGEEARRINE